MRFAFAALLITISATPLAAREIAGATYVEPSDAYGHGAVKGGEYAGLRIDYDDGTQNTIRFEGAVYEDIAPRLYDIDADGTPEVIAVLSGFNVGAMVQIIDYDGEWARPIGATVPIGERHRWLAIAGIADFDGNGVPDIAFVDRPHLAKTLRVVSVELTEDAVSFTPLGEVQGLSNHLIGTSEIEGGVRNCPGSDPVVLTANADWTKVMETRWDGFALRSAAVAEYVGPGSFAPFLDCN